MSSALDCDGLHESGGKRHPPVGMFKSETSERKNTPAVTATTLQHAKRQLTWMQMVSSEIMLPALGPTTVAPSILPPEFFSIVILAKPSLMPSHLHRSTWAISR